MAYDGYFTKSDLKKRGWTTKMFERHLPVPHKTVLNRNNPDWRPTCLYDMEIVKKIESDPEFQRYKEWTVGFRARMREVARKKNESRSNA